MGKGGSGMAAIRLTGQEVAGEYRRTVADASLRRSAGFADAEEVHEWAIGDRGRRFDDLFNLVHDLAVLVGAWRRVRGNKGKRSGAVDRGAPVDITAVAGSLAARQGDGRSRRRLGAKFVALIAANRVAHAEKVTDLRSSQTKNPGGIAPAISTAEQAWDDPASESVGVNEV